MQEDSIKNILFAILCICFIFYLFIGIYSYKKDSRSKSNVKYLILCISTSLWAIGYAFMLISPNIEIANIWRIVSALGWCFFSAFWISFAFTLNDTNKKSSTSKIQFLLYITAIIFFISNLIYAPSKMVASETYGFIDILYTTTPIGNVFSIYISIMYISTLILIYFRMKTCLKKRVKKQIKTIFITSLISLFLGSITDLILPAFGIVIFPAGIITISIAMGGQWYAINKYKMMTISFELISEYLFESVNEPIFILGEDFLVKNCNEMALNITGYKYNDLKENSLEEVIDIKSLNFNTLMQTGNITNIEVNLLTKNKEIVICELSATVIYDEYKDILGILILLHDISERLLAQKRIHHFVYYDSLTEVCNRKKMREDIDILLDNKDKEFAILFIDLDKFKSANDNYGHQVGDYLLKTAAMRLKSIIKSTDTIYRIGGDEFIIILRNLKTIEEAKKIAVAVLETLRIAFNYKENKLFIGASIGISIFPEHGIDEDTLSKNADIAMYEIKRSGGNGYKIYTPE